MYKYNAPNVQQGCILSLNLLEEDYTNMNEMDNPNNYKLKIITYTDLENQIENNGVFKILPDQIFQE